MSDTALLNDRYHLQELLGTGGMAFVYKAHDRMLERTVAIKVLRENLSQDASFRERFRQEAKAAANLSHPNIVTVHDFGLDDDKLFIVMEHMPGTDLKSMIEEQKVFAVEDAISVIVKVCAGVGYAHRAGLVHCDMKPHNVLVSTDQRVKVTDFRIARALASINPHEKTEIVWGSPQYFSPEQARGLAPSPSSDVYGIGIMLYEMLTGSLPFVSTSAAELARMHREAPPPRPRELNPQLSEDVQKILLKVLSKEPSARYRTADQLGRVLQTIAKRPEEMVSTLPRPSSSPARVPDDPPPGSKTKPQKVAKPPKPKTEPRLQTQPRPIADKDALKIDWVNIGVLLLTILAVFGQFPFWIWVYFQLNPPI
jgi:serine/threonine-protein kinase